MARRSQKNRREDEDAPKGMEGVNILTNTDFGVFVEGAEGVIDMYEKGEISPQDLYNAILDLEVVYKSKNVESSAE
jgi:hypothetical protein